MAPLYECENIVAQSFLYEDESIAAYPLLYKREKIAAYRVRQDSSTAKHSARCTDTLGRADLIQDDTAWFVGGNSPQGVKAMQMELLMHGPGVVGFWIYDDFMAYSGGVYHKSENATKLGTARLRAAVSD
eukprot:263360-Rhodomonas_salina.4